MPQTAGKSSSELIDIIVFSISGVLCGLRIDDVQEIKKTGTITRVHHAPEYVRGVINLRGQIVTVIDMCKKLEYTPSDTFTHKRTVLVKHEDEYIGLLVDTIEDAIVASADDIHPPPANISVAEQRYFSGVCETEELVVALLDKNLILEKATKENSSTHDT